MSELKVGKAIIGSETAYFKFSDGSTQTTAYTGGGGGGETDGANHLPLALNLPSNVNDVATAVEPLDGKHWIWAPITGGGGGGGGGDVKCVGYAQWCYKIHQLKYPNDTILDGSQLPSTTTVEISLDDEMEIWPYLWKTPIKEEITVTHIFAKTDQGFLTVQFGYQRGIDGDYNHTEPGPDWTVMTNIGGTLRGCKTSKEEKVNISLVKDTILGVQNISIEPDDITGLYPSYASVGMRYTYILPAE